MNHYESCGRCHGHPCCCSDRATNPTDVVTERLKRSRELLDCFLGAVEKRMAKGERNFGDRNYSTDPLELIREVKEELEDVAGWASILWARLDGIERALRRSHGPSTREIELESELSVARAGLPRAP